MHSIVPPHSTPLLQASTVQFSDKLDWEDALSVALEEATEGTAPPPQDGEQHPRAVKFIDYLLEVVGGADAEVTDEPAQPRLTRQNAFSATEIDALLSITETTTPATTPTTPTPPTTPTTPTTQTKKRCCIKKREHPICARVMNKEFYCTKRLGHLGLCAA